MGRSANRTLGADGFPICCVYSCGRSLRECKVYNMRFGICPLHVKADIIVQHGVGGTLENMRFCHQCGRLEPLFAFIGSQRSCAASLHKKRSYVKRERSKKGEEVGPSVHLRA
jgi:hypothetical protein